MNQSRILSSVMNLSGRVFGFKDRDSPRILVKTIHAHKSKCVLFHHEWVEYLSRCNLVVRQNKRRFVQNRTRLGIHRWLSVPQEWLQRVEFASDLSLPMVFGHLLTPYFTTPSSVQ
jgi:hypothetical protein